MPKFYKIFSGEIVEISSAITDLYQIKYFSEKNIEEFDWLYYNEKELKIGEKIKVYDSEKKMIIGEKDAKKYEESPYSDK